MAVASVLAASEAARADLVLTSNNSGTVKYTLYFTSGAGASTTPVFDTNPASPTFGQLTAPGIAFPSLLVPTTGNPTQTVSGSLSPSPLVAPSVTGSTGNAVPVPFGTANTVISALNATQQGLVTSQAGLFWDSRTSLADNIPAGLTGLASVSYSTATATFINTDLNNAVSINPGTFLSAQGTIGGSGNSFVAAGLYSTYTLSGSSTVVTDTPIAVAANNLGQTVNQAGSIPGDNAVTSYTNVNGTKKLFVTADSFFSGQSISVAAGQSITITATLTLISDPMSSISIVSGLAPGFPGDATLPNFGAFVGGPQPAAVPEPSAIAMLGLGLATAGAWSARARVRRSARA